MRTLLRTNIENNKIIYVKEKVETIKKRLEDKSKFINVTKRKFIAGRLYSERKVLIRKTLIKMVDLEKITGL